MSVRDCEAPCHLWFDFAHPPHGLLLVKSIMIAIAWIMPTRDWELSVLNIA